VVRFTPRRKKPWKRARAGEGPILIEAKSFRRQRSRPTRRGGVRSKEMRAYWEARDPIDLYEKVLASEKLLDAKGKREVEEKNQHTSCRGARFCREFAYASARICGDRRLLHRRRLPQNPREVGAADSGSDAAKIERHGSMDGSRIWIRQKAPAARTRRFILATRRLPRIVLPAKRNPQMARSPAPKPPSKVEGKKAAKAGAASSSRKARKITMAKSNGAATNGGASNGTPITFLEAIKQAMFEEMERDPAVVLIGEDVGVYGGAFKTSEGLLERFGWSG